MGHSMDAIKQNREDMRWAALAPAIVGHGVLLAVLFAIPMVNDPGMPTPERVEFLPDPQVIDVVFYEPETFTSIPEEAGLEISPDPRLGTPEGGIQTQPAVAEDIPFSVAAADQGVESQLVSAEKAVEQEATEIGRLGDGGDALSALRIALRRQSCQRLVEHPDPTCPTDDPFLVQARLEAVRTARPLRRTDAAPITSDRMAQTYLAQATSSQPQSFAGIEHSVFMQQLSAGAFDAAPERSSPLRVSWTAPATEGLQLTLN